MPIEVQLPDGSIAEFPDGMPAAQIEQVLAQQFAPTEQQQQPQPAQAPQALSPEVAQYEGVPKIGETPEQLAAMDQRFKANVAQGLPKEEALRQALNPIPSAEAMGDFAQGFIPAAATLVSGAIAEPIGGIAGLVASPASFLGADPGFGAKVSETVSGALTVPPMFGSEKVLEGLGQTLEPTLGAVGRIPRQAGEIVADKFDSPMAGTIVETGLSAIPEALGLGKTKILTKAETKKVDIPEPEQVGVAREASEATGVDLFEGQQTLSAPVLERQSFVQQLPAGVQKASKELGLQNKQASDAVDNILAQIAPDESIVVGSERFRSASQRAIARRKDIRAEAASPIYNEAFADAKKNNTFVDVEDLIDDTRGVSSGFPEGGEVSRSFGKINKWLTSASKRKTKFDSLKLRTAVTVERQNLSQLHNAKLEIDQMLNRKFEGSLGNTTKGKLVDIKKKLVDRLAKASPKYDEARAKFEELSPGVEALENSVIGKIANIKDTQLKSVSRSIFDPQNSNIKTVTDAKKIISEVDPDAWDMLMRSEIERRMGSIKPELGASMENIPGKLSNAIFGAGKQRDVLMAGATGETRKALGHLETALRRAGLGRQQGSQTASRAEISKELRGGIVSGVRDLFRSPIDTIVRTGENAQFDRRVSAMAEALFDPRYKAEASKLIRTGKGKEFTRLILSIEAMKASATPETEEQVQAQ